MKGYRFTYDSEEPEFISRCLIKDKEEVLKAAQIMKDQMLETLIIDNDHSFAYYKITEALFDNFIKDVTATPIMRICDKWWHYVIEKNPDGVALVAQMIDYISFEFSEEKGVCCRENDFKGRHIVLMQPIKKLSVEDYAKKYGVEEVTVRQWIRRGKLRTAEKIGNEWGIPELADTPRRGYEPGYFEIKDEYYHNRDFLPESYAFLKNANQIQILQDEDDRNQFNIYYDDSVELGMKSIRMDSKEREKLELFLISTPYYRCMDMRSGGTYECATKDGEALFIYLRNGVTREDLEKTGPGINAESKTELDLMLDGYTFINGKAWVRCDNFCCKKHKKQ